MSDINSKDREESLKLLIEDLKHFGESFWRNEEVGEKRFNFRFARTLCQLGTVSVRRRHRGISVAYALCVKPAMVSPGL